MEYDREIIGCPICKGQGHIQTGPTVNFVKTCEGCCGTGLVEIIKVKEPHAS